MNARNLLLIAMAIGSAALGAGLAIMTHLPSKVSISPAASPSPIAQVPSLPSGTTPITETEPVLFPPPGALAASTAEAPSPNEFDQLTTQLRRAIRDRNPVLLRSLMQAGSLRQALSNVAEAEQLNFENLDASAWTVLEKAMNYRCRQQMILAGKDSAACLNNP